MDGIDRKSPIKRVESRNKHLKTLRYTPIFSSIDAVEPIRPVINQLNNQKPSFMFDIDTLQSHANDMQNAYNRLHARENKLKDLIQSFQEDPEGFLGQIRELIKQFNQTTASVLTLDRAYHTMHSEVLSDLLARQQFNLEKMGISIVGINQLEFDGAFFKKAVRNRQDFFDAVFLPGLSLFERSFAVISGIRINTGNTPQPGNSNTASIVQKSRINQKG